MAQFLNHLWKIYSPCYNHRKKKKRSIRKKNTFEVDMIAIQNYLTTNRKYETQTHIHICMAIEKLSKMKHTTTTTSLSLSMTCIWTHTPTTNNILSAPYGGIMLNYFAFTETRTHIHISNKWIFVLCLVCICVFSMHIWDSRR